MKSKLSILTMVFLMGLSAAGCHSGTVRGVGSDVEKLGEHMQK